MFHFIHDIILSMNERNSEKIMQVLLATTNKAKIKYRRNELWQDY